MVESPPTGPPPSPPPPVPRPPLQLDATDKWLAGVAGGLARTLGIPSWIVRLAFVLLTLAGGIMIFAYLALWFFLPDESGHVIAREVSAGNESWLPVAGVVILAIAFAATIGVFGSKDAGILVPAVLVAGGVALLASRDRPAPVTAGAAPAPPPGTSPAASSPDVPPPPVASPAATSPAVTPTVPPVRAAATSAGSVASSTTGPPVPPPAVPSTAVPPSTVPPSTVPSSASYPPIPPPRIAPYEVVSRPPAPRPPKPRPFLTPLTLSALAIAGGVAFLLDRSGDIELHVGSMLAVGLTVIGAVLILATWVGRARGLIAVGLVLLPIAALAAVVSVPFDKGLGQQRYAPVETSGAIAYEYGIGELTVDLRDLEFTGVTEVQADLGIGSLVVLVPGDVAVDIHGEAGAGEIRVTESEELSGRFGRAVDTTVTTESGLGAELDHTLDAETETARRIELDAEVGMGEVVVRRDTASS